MIKEIKTNRVLLAIFVLIFIAIIVFLIRHQIIPTKKSRQTQLTEQMTSELSETKCNTDVTIDSFKLVHFPFDSLIEHAEEITINLDEVPQQELKLIRLIGHAENPAPDEPIFSQPKSLAMDSNNKIYVADATENQIIVCSIEGKLLQHIGRKGRGPGEFINLSSIYINQKDELYINQSFRIQKFNKSYIYQNNFTLMKVKSLFSDISMINNILFFPVAQNVPGQPSIEVYDLSKEKPQFISSFFKAIAPEKNFSNQQSAILSRNNVNIASDAQRFLSVNRTHQLFFYLIDLKQQKAIKFKLNGISPATTDNANLPNIAVRFMVKDCSFDNNFCYVLIENKILKIDLLNFNNLKILLISEKSNLWLNSIQVKDKKIFALSFVQKVIGLFDQ